jgi:LacI family transcriptional regulator
MQKKRPTIQDVARLSGLSVSTVSLVINNRGYVSAETREKILSVIEHLSYHPTRSAQGLASKTSGNLGFILTQDHFSRAEPFYTRIFLGTEFEARNHNFYILLTTVSKTFRSGSEIPRFLLERNVDGVVAAGRVDTKLLDYIDTHGIPIVLVDYELKRQRFSSVLIDNLAGAHLAVKHLIECGHREIGFIAGDLRHPSIAERYAGFKEALREHAIPYRDELCSIDQPDTRVNDGTNAIRAILERGARPTAVFAANDAMAIGCVRRVRELGIRIPQDLAIVGFDDIDMSSHVEPRLTTVRVFKEEMGKLAVLRLVDIIQKEMKHVVTTRVPVELVVRESTGGKPTETEGVVEEVTGLPFPMS